MMHGRAVGAVVFGVRPSPIWQSEHWPRHRSIWFSVSRSRLLAARGLVSCNQAGKRSTWPDRVVWNERVAPLFSMGVPGMDVGIADPFFGSARLGLNNRVGDVIRSLYLNNQLLALCLDHKIRLIGLPAGIFDLKLLGARFHPSDHKWFVFTVDQHREFSLFAGLEPLVRVAALAKAPETCFLVSPAGTTGT